MDMSFSKKKITYVCVYYTIFIIKITKYKVLWILITFIWSGLDHLNYQQIRRCLENIKMEEKEKRM